MKKLIYILVLPLLIFSCSTDEASQQTIEITVEDILVQREVLTKADGEIITADFMYNGNRLASSVSSEGYSIIYTYDNDLLSELDIVENGVTIITVNLEYDIDKLTSYTASFAHGLVERFDFTYNSETSITVKRFSGDSTNQVFEDDIEVSLKDGNITSVTFPNYSLQYQYDDRNCTYKNVFAIDILNYVGLDFGGFEGIVNNPTMRVETEDGMTETETFTHTYNVNGFPLTTDVILNGAPYGTIEYFY